MSKPRIRVFPNMLRGTRIGDYFVYRRARESDGELCIVASMSLKGLLPKIAEFERCAMMIDDMPTIAMRYLTGDIQTMQRTIQTMVKYRIAELRAKLDKKLKEVSRGR